MNENDTTTKELKERTSYYEGLKEEIISLKSNLEKSKKWYEETLQVFKEQGNGFKKEIIVLRTQLEKPRSGK